MDLKEFKKIITFARRNGVKTLKVDGFEIEFQNSVILPKRPRGRSALATFPQIPPPPPEPTIDQIYDYIHSEGEAS